MRLVDRMYYDIDSARYETLANVGGLEEEYESESDLEEDVEDSTIQGPPVATESLPYEPEGGEEALKTEREDRVEFLRTQGTGLRRNITERFLSGLDTTFDYSAIDDL